MGLHDGPAVAGLAGVTAIAGVAAAIRKTHMVAHQRDVALEGEGGCHHHGEAEKSGPHSLPVGESLYHSLDFGYRPTSSNRLLFRRR